MAYPVDPNDLEPCPSFSCAVWHAAHGYGEHRCGRDPLAKSRVERPALRETTRRWPEALPDDVTEVA